MEAALAFYWRHYRAFLYPPLAVGGAVSIAYTLGYWLLPEWSDSVGLAERTAPITFAAGAAVAANAIIFVLWSVHTLTRGKKYATLATLCFSAVLFAAAETLTLLFVSYQYGWFSNLVSDQAETAWTIFLIVADSASKGAFLDMMESYGLSISRFEPESGTLVFDTIVFVSRTLWSFLAAATAYTSFKWLRRRLGREVSRTDDD